MKTLGRSHKVGLRLLVWRTSRRISGMLVNLWVERSWPDIPRCKDCLSSARYSLMLVVRKLVESSQKLRLRLYFESPQHVNPGDGCVQLVSRIHVHGETSLVGQSRGADLFRNSSTAADSELWSWSGHRHCYRESWCFELLPIERLLQAAKDRRERHVDRPRGQATILLVTARRHQICDIEFQPRAQGDDDTSIKGNEERCVRKVNRKASRREGNLAFPRHTCLPSYAHHVRVPTLHQCHQPYRACWDSLCSSPGLNAFCSHSRISVFRLVHRRLAR